MQPRNLGDNASDHVVTVNIFVVEVNMHSITQTDEFRCIFLKEKARTGRFCMSATPVFKMVLSIEVYVHFIVVKTYQHGV